MHTHAVALKSISPISFTATVLESLTVFTKAYRIRKTVKPLTIVAMKSVGENWYLVVGRAGGRVDVAVSRRLSRGEVFVLPQLTPDVSTRRVFWTTISIKEKHQCVFNNKVALDITKRGILSLFSSPKSNDGRGGNVRSPKESKNRQFRPNVYVWKKERKKSWNEKKEKIILWFS